MYRQVGREGGREGRKKNLTFAFKLEEEGREEGREGGSYLHRRTRGGREEGASSALVH
jgi:hypothetical protein